MPDISMCLNNECLSREECYRFKAVPDPYRQSYAGFKVPEGDDRCGYFIENWKRKEAANG